MNPNPLFFIDFAVYRNDLDKIDWSTKNLINTINQYSFCIAQKDVAFKKALQGSDILLPDGMSIVAAARLLTKTKITKIAGAQLHDFLLHKLDESGGSCFYLGASEATLAKITAKVNLQFPKVKVHSYSPPYKVVFAEVDNQNMLAAVNAVSPEVLFIGMTAPKQEKWAFEHKDFLQAQTICSIGAVFDFYAGTVKRPSAFWISLRLEWLIRLIKEPRRMWKRYLFYGPVFIAYILRKKVSMLFQKSPN